MYEYGAALVRVVDGDTVVLTLDLGLHVRFDVTVRLLGVDCPELATAAGKAARAAAVGWFESHRHAGGGWVVNTHRDRTEKYGRYLATVRCPADGAGLVTDLIAGGHVKAAPAPGPGGGELGRS